MDIKGAAAITSPIANAGNGSAPLLNAQKDAKEAQTDAKFGDVWKNVQKQYGAPTDKPRQVKKQMDKDDFLKIMVTQMKNQDPTNPMKADQFATQLAQFTSVEQLQNLNSQMKKMATANQPLERLALTNMIGKVVTVDRDRFQHTETETSPLTYELPENAKSVTISVINEAGEKVFSKELGAMPAGKQTYHWDGNKDTGEAMKSGGYIFRVQARGEMNQAIDMKSQSQEQVVGITFEGGEGMLLVGDAKSPTKTALKNVIRVDQGMSAPLQSAPGAKRAGLDPNVQALLQARGGQVAGNNDPSNENIYTNNNEKNEAGGFPNGISSGDDQN